MRSWKYGLFILLDVTGCVLFCEFVLMPEVVHVVTIRASTALEAVDRSWFKVLFWFFFKD